VRVAPFTGYIDERRATKYLSFALADAGASPQTAAAALPGLREAFAGHGRTARIEVIEELFPSLPGVLDAAGWTLSERMPAMVCTRDSLLAPPAPEGLVVERLGPTSPEELFLRYQSVQRIAFEDDEPVRPEHTALVRRRSDTWVCVAGILDGEVVGAANCTAAALGVVEVGGVATLQKVRGRGIAGTLTAAAVAAAFAAGADLAWLSAADDAAQRIYARAGFAVRATQSAYDAPG
jgi:ribosomal protein S18 acetylase RimI-like enzyme